MSIRATNIGAGCPARKRRGTGGDDPKRARQRGGGGEAAGMMKMVVTIGYQEYALEAQDAILLLEVTRRMIAASFQPSSEAGKWQSDTDAAAGWRQGENDGLFT